MSESKYSNVQEVAKFFDISESTVRLWVKKGLIDRSCYVKADTTYRFDIPAIEKYLRGEGSTPVESHPELILAPTQEVPELDIGLDEDF